MHTHTSPFSFLLSPCCLLLQRIPCDHKNYQSCWISSFPFYVWTWVMTWLFFPQFFGQFASASLGASPTLWKTLLYFGDEVDACFLKVKKNSLSPFPSDLGSVFCCNIHNILVSQLKRWKDDSGAVTLSTEKWWCSFARVLILIIYTCQTYSWWRKWADSLPASRTAGQAVPPVIPDWWQVHTGYLAGSEVHMHECTSV